MEPLEEHDVKAMLARTHGSLDDAVACSYFDSVSDSDVDYVGDMIRDQAFSLHYLLSSEIDEESKEFCRIPKSAVFLEGGNLMEYLAHEEREGAIHSAELFGGEGGSTKVAIRRRLKTRKIFDLVW